MKEVAILVQFLFDAQQKKGKKKIITLDVQFSKGLD